MASPFTRGTLTTFANGPGAGTDNLTSLPSATAYGLGALDLSAAVVGDVLFAPLKIKSGSTGTSASGYVRRYLITSEDNSLWTDGISPSAVSNQLSKIVTARLIDAIAVTANATTYYFEERSVMDILGFVPRYVAIVLDNESGHALDTVAGSFAAQYSVDAFA